MNEDKILGVLSDHYESLATTGLALGRMGFDIAAPLLLAILNFLGTA
ncbi:hypothetical protein ACFXK0_24980 [Nocardia sp. NPDC059177]